ncbi:STM4015 family protein [Streptomonospora nanhaiensis]|uniref:STM4015 family protein n=1 Tax=Streptomonospora nanhaiensis TaxID=1323731 RepID=A0ABY6YGF1_9ACTN|nr:STM4015 family protein [Streptomonospora nanhaiensis]WAE71322.1 STM4015 family protein [Streptomonospora nanhaiensis]
MVFNHHLSEFAGLPVVEYRSATAFEGASSGPPPELLAALADPGSVAWRLDDANGQESDSDTSPLGYYRRFAEAVDQDRVAAIVIGDVCNAFVSEGNSALAESLVEVAPRLSGLRSLFYGDVTFDECELSWIRHEDMSFLLRAFPQLTEFAVRGTEALYLHVPRHESLRRLTLQGGGLPGELAREVASSGYPELEHLELWLGVPEYGGDTSPGDLAPVLGGEAFPRLRSLGLCNAQDVDDWITVLADAPLTRRLHTLDLSRGALADEGGRALAEAAPAFAHLDRLNLHHHFLSEEVGQRIREALPGVEIDLSEPREPRAAHNGDGVRYYTAVSE